MVNEWLKQMFETLHKYLKNIAKISFIAKSWGILYIKLY